MLSSHKKYIILVIGLIISYIEENKCSCYRSSDVFLKKKIQELGTGLVISYIRKYNYCLVISYIHDIRKHILANCGPLKEFIKGFLTSTERGTLSTPQLGVAVYKYI